MVRRPMCLTIPARFASTVLCSAARVAVPIPIVGIGGITLENAAQVIAAGASTVAVISDLLVGGDPERRVAAFVAALER